MGTKDLRCRVGAADKYAQLAASGAVRPRCGCGRLMVWNADARTRAGGAWRCAAHWHDRSRALIADERRRRGGVCGRCGVSGALHWHHRDPASRRFGIGNGACRSLAAIRVELAKCDLLCPRCHRAEHARMRDRASRASGNS